jgi:hypothetical protein
MLRWQHESRHCCLQEQTSLLEQSITAIAASALVIDGDTRACRLACISICFAIATANGCKYQWANGGSGLACALSVRHPAITGSQIAILVRAGASCSHDPTAGELMAPLTITQRYSERKKVNTQLGAPGYRVWIAKAAETSGLKRKRSTWTRRL